MRENPRKDDRDDSLRRPWRDYWGGSGPRYQYGKTDGPFAGRGDTVTVSIYSDFLTDTGRDITSCVNITSITGATGTWVEVTEFAGGHVFKPLDCV